LKRIVQGKAPHPPQDAKGGGEAAAATAATAALALPSAVRFQALAALWYLGRRAGCGALCDQAAEALRSAWIIATPAAAAAAAVSDHSFSSSHPIRGSTRAARSGLLYNDSPVPGDTGSGSRSTAYVGSKEDAAAALTERKSGGDDVSDATAATATGGGAVAAVDGGDDAGSDDIVLVVTKPRRHG
ncbi:hypothetical protein Vretimale_17496, partial [Volvox reticuliferus]